MKSRATNSSPRTSAGSIENPAALHWYGCSSSSAQPMLAAKLQQSSGTAVTQDNAWLTSLSATARAPGTFWESCHSSWLGSHPSGTEIGLHRPSLPSCGQCRLFPTSRCFCQHTGGSPLSGQQCTIKQANHKREEKKLEKKKVNVPWANASETTREKILKNSR